MFHLERVHIPYFSVYLNRVLRYSLCAPSLSQALLSNGPFSKGTEKWRGDTGLMQNGKQRVGLPLGWPASRAVNNGMARVSNQIIVLLYNRKSASRWNVKGAILSLLQHEDVTVNGILLLLTVRHSPGYITHRASVPEAFHSGLNVFWFWIRFSSFIKPAVPPSQPWF